MTDKEIMQQMLEFLEGGDFVYPTKLATALREALAQPEQEPVAQARGGQMSFTERQQRLIDKCKSAGYGWRKFAESVERSGKCSPKQEDTLCIMTQRIGTAEAAKAGHFKSYGKNSISDSEIMSFGLHL